eukprot:gene9382-10362_t
MLTNYASKYYGSQELVQSESADSRLVVTNLLYLKGELQAQKGWERVNAELDKLITQLEATPPASPSSALLYKYQMELLRQVVVPYLQKLKGRFHTDEKRQSQLLDVLYFVTNPPIHHPAEALLRLETVAEDIRRQGFYFKSELLLALEGYLQTQWRPLIMVTQSLLRNMGSKLIGVGLIGVIGWPLAVLYPMLLTSQQLAQVVKELETKKTLSPSSLFCLGKLVVFVLVSLQLVRVLEAYLSVAYLAVIAAVICFTVSGSNDLIKVAVVPLAPYGEILEASLTLSIDQLVAVMQGKQPILDANGPQGRVTGEARVEVLSEERHDNPNHTSLLEEKSSSELRKRK